MLLTGKQRFDRERNDYKTKGTAALNIAPTRYAAYKKHPANG